MSGSWCPQCGPSVKCDEDGCCAHCGATATGDGADAALAATRADLETDDCTRCNKSVFVRPGSERPEGWLCWPCVMLYRDEVERLRDALEGSLRSSRSARNEK